MDAYQGSIYNVGLATKGVADANSSVWETFDPFADGMVLLTTNLAAIEVVLTRQGVSTKGITIAKNLIRMGMIPDLLKTAAMLTIVGELTNDPALVQQGKVRKSILERGKADNFIGMAKRVIDAGQSVSLTVRTPYGITNDLLTALSTQLFNFTLAMPTTRVAESKNVAATREMARLIAEQQYIMEARLDPAAYLLSDTYPDFYSQYLVARKIVDPSYRTRALQVLVTDSTDGAALEKVKAVINPGNIEKMTSINGVFYITNMESGNYTMECERPGYVTITKHFSVTSGLRTDLTVALVPA